MSNDSHSDPSQEDTERNRKERHSNNFEESSNGLGGGLGYDGKENSSDPKIQPNIEFTYEIIEIDGPEGHYLTLAQARALRRALEWAAAHDQQASRTSTSGDGEEKPRAA